MALTAIAGLAAPVVPGVFAQRTTGKPRLPPGRDPGGVAIALIGAGVDYTKPEIARRLARDGEGDLIGWDVIDNDNRPYERPDGAGLPPPHAGTLIAGELMHFAAGTRLVPVRIAMGPTDHIGRALSFVGRSPARIAVLACGGLTEESSELLGLLPLLPRHLLVIMPADLFSPPYTRIPDIPNLLIVASGLATPPHRGALIVANGIDQNGPEFNVRGALLADMVSIRRVVAKAAEMLAQGPQDLDGWGLKRAVVAHFKPLIGVDPYPNAKR